MGKKYIIELEDKPFHNGNGDFLYRVKGFNSLVFDMTGVGKLTPYTESDLEQVRKEAYENGWKEAEDHYEKGYNDGYDTGLSDAWEAARNVVALSTVDRRKVFGSEYMYSILEKHTASEAIEKIRQYEQEKEEKITKGDVVRIKSAPEVEILVTYADEEHVSGIALTEVDGNCEIGDQYTDIVIHKVEKTGRHYEIAEVLKKMREE